MGLRTEAQAEGPPCTPVCRPGAGEPQAYQPMDLSEEWATGGRQEDSQITVVLSRPSGHLPQATTSESAQCPSPPLCRLPLHGGHCRSSLPATGLALLLCLEPPSPVPKCHCQVLFEDQPPPWSCRWKPAPGTRDSRETLILAAQRVSDNPVPAVAFSSMWTPHDIPQQRSSVQQHRRHGLECGTTATADASLAPSPRMVAHLYSASLRDVITLVFDPLFGHSALPFDSPQLPLTSS